MNPRACHACQAPNDPRRRYCGSCGVKLVVICGRCGFDNQGADRFCGLCGDGLAAGIRPTVAVAPAPPPPPPAAPSSQWITDADLDKLAARPAARSDAKLPSRFSQNDLDSLFGEAE